MHCLLDMWHTPACQADMEKYNFFTRARIEPKLFLQNWCVNYNKSKYATRQHKISLTTTMSKIGLPHKYRGNIYVKSYFVPLVKVKVKNLLN